MGKICGIYKITSPTGKVYIGQSINCRARYTHYKNGHGKDQVGLYRSIQKHGWDSHTFEIIFECEQEKLNEMEVYYISLFNSFGPPHGLNLTEGGCNWVRSVETRKKMSQSQMGKKMPLEVREKISKGHTGKKHSQETLLKMSIGRTGIKHTEEAKKKISLGHIGLKRTKEQCENMSKLRMGRVVTSETRHKISLANKGKKLSEERKRNMSLYRKGKKISGESRKKIILNLMTGIFYIGIKDAAKSIGKPNTTLGRKLCGITKNNTSFIYV